MRALSVSPLIPNKGSKHRTPASLQVDLHYAELNIVGRWNWERFKRLSAFLKLTHGELASIVCLTHKRMESCARANRFDAPVALLLTLLEAEYLADYSNDVIANPFPDALRVHPRKEKSDTAAAP